jgi:hypothetical protein
VHSKRVLIRGQYEVVFTGPRHDLLYGCWLPSGKTTFLADQLEAWAGPPAMDVAGRWATVYTGANNAVELWDLRAGKYKYGVTGSANQVGVMVVSVHGNVAWTACDLAEGNPARHDDCDRADRRAVAVRIRIRGSSGGASRGVRLVTSEPWLDPTSLKLRHGKLTWRVNGKLHGIRFS